MHPFPHHYHVASSAAPDGEVVLRSDGAPDLPTLTPPEFGGPGGQWSPETLLVGAVIDCLILTFRGIARASRMPWVRLDVECTGTLERPDRVTQFTQFELRASIVIPAGVDDEQARRLLGRAEETCLITRSLKAATHLEIAVVRSQDQIDASQPA
jgi:organic hydroperoxide reductase OsmC/OhrA